MNTKLFDLHLASLSLLFALGSQLAATEQITDLNGKSTSAVIKTIDSNGTIAGDGIQGALKLDQVAEIITGNSSKPVKSVAILNLVGKGEMRVSSIATNAESVDIQIGDERWNIPIENVRAVVFDQSFDPKLLAQAIAAADPSSDRVIASTPRGNQTVTGQVKAITRDKVQFKYQGKDRTISRSKVVAVVFADYGVKPIDGTSVFVKTTGGSRIHSRILGLKQGQLEFQLPGGSQHKVAWKNVSAIEIQSDRIVYLSNLDPVDQQHEPIVTVEQQWKRNLSVQGNPIRLRTAKDQPARIFANGIGMHSFSQLVFRNEKNADRFLALVGIDVETEGRGDCKVAVTGDGVELWSTEITGTDLAIEVNVDISGVKEIGLTVYPGNHLDMADHVDWAMARLMKSSK